MILKIELKSSSCNQGSRLSSLLSIYLFIYLFHGRDGSILQYSKKKEKEDLYVQDDACEISLLPLLYEEYINICKLRDKNIKIYIDLKKKKK